MFKIDHYLLSLLLTAISTFVLGIFVYSRNTRSQVNRCFMTFSMAIALWSIGVFNCILAPNLLVSLFWARILHIAATFIPVFFVTFVLAMLNIERSKILLWVYGVSGAVAVLFLSPLMLRGVGPKYSYVFFAQPGSLYPLHMVLFFSLILYAYYELFRAFKHSYGVRREQIRYFLWTTLVGYSGGSVNFLLNYGFKVFPLYPFGNYTILFYVVIITYAIVTTRLMDVEIVIKKGIVYSVLSVILAGMYISSVYLSEVVFRGLTGYSSLWVMIPSILVISMLFQPIQARLQGAVDNLFFKSRYDYQKVLMRYAHTLRRPTTDLDRFLKIAPYLVSKHMKLAGGAVLILDRAHNRYEVRAVAAGDKDLLGIAISDNYELIRELRANGETIVKDEVEEKIRRSKGREKERYETLKAEMEKLKASLVIPSISLSEYFVNPTLIAVFVFGPKLSEDQFSREDIEFLETLSRQASITVEYAFILEELKRDEQKVIQAEKFAALGLMAGSVVSAIKAPLEDMENYSITMSKRFDDPSFRDGFVKDIPQDITRLDRVVNDLLIYARPMKLNLAEVKFNALVEKAIELLKVKEFKEHIAVKKDFRALPDISADPQHLLNALMRLVSFAVSAAKSEIKIDTSPCGPGVCISITIPGVVIPKEALEKIFSSYYSPKEGEGGLELATAAKIIKEHGGDVKAESEPSFGTRLTAVLPVMVPVVANAENP